MGIVNGVLGPLDTSALGFTLMHEHVLVLNWAMRMNVPSWFDREREMAQAVGRLRTAKAKGVRTVVDPTPIDLGRDILFLREAAEKSGMQIVCATGFYHTPPVNLRWWSTDALTELLIRDITEGAAGTDVRCGVVKCATDEEGITPANAKLLRLAARLHRRTGVPILTHSHPATRGGTKQQDMFEAEGVDLGRVLIGHSGDTTDIGYLEQLIERGSYIGMDRFGLDNVLSFEERVDTVVTMCEKGYAGRMVLSHDAACFIDWFPKGSIASFAPRWHFTHIIDDVIPALKERGVSDADIRRMTVDNPRQIFENQGVY